MLGLIWVKIVLKSYQQMSISYEGLTQSYITSNQLQLVLTIYVWPDLGQNCLKE